MAGVKGVVEVRRTIVAVYLKGVQGGENGGGPGCGEGGLWDFSKQAADW
jgi:hypothetical protein